MNFIFLYRPLFEIGQISSKVLDTSDRYHWSQKLQGFILSSFFVGNILSQIPGGILVQKYGGKWIYLICIFSSALTIALIPVAVNYGEENKIKINLIHSIVDCSIFSI